MCGRKIGAEGSVLQGLCYFVIFSSPEPKAHKVSLYIVYIPVEPSSVRASTFSNRNISETSRQIAIKFYLKHHWGGGKASVGFDLDGIRTLVSMATDSSHIVIMGKTASSRFLSVFDRILFILAGNDDMNESLDEFEIWPDSTSDLGVSSP